jgi:hypothetical protein
MVLSVMSFSIESALRKADRLHKGGEFAAAQQLYEDILQKNSLLTSGRSWRCKDQKLV